MTADDAAFARIDVQHPEIEKGYLREHRKRRGEPERADPAGFVSGQPFGVFRRTRLEMRHARKPLELVQGYALVAVHERHDCLPSLPVVEHKAFYDVVFAQPKLPGRVLRAAPFDKTIFQTPHVLTRFFQNTDGRCLSFPVHSSPPGSSYRQEIPYIPLTVDCFSRLLPLPLFSSDACRCFFDTRLERFPTGILPKA